MRKRIGVVFASAVLISAWSASGDEPTAETNDVAAPVAGTIRDQASRTVAFAEINHLITAVKLYETDYAVLPLGNIRAEKEISTSAEFIDILTGADAEQNPKQRVYLGLREAKHAVGKNPRHSGAIDEGNGSKRLVDPWGNEYALILDADGDGEIKVPGQEATIRAGAVCWSYGKPKDPNDPKSAKNNDPKEWITSWAPEPKREPQRGGIGAAIGSIFEAGGKAKMNRVKADLHVLKAALNVYRINAGTFPSTEQGLGALIKKPTTGRVPKRWEQTLKAEQLDPWGQPYGYRYPGMHNQGMPDIWSFGPDLIDGTEDDLGNW